MKVLMISGDKNILTHGSGAHTRLELQRAQVELLDVFVWPQTHSGWQIYRAARKNHYDIITAQDPFWRGLVGLKIAWLTGTKLNVQVHTDLSAQPLFRHVLAQIVLRHADSVRVVSEKIALQVRGIAPRVRVDVLPVYVAVHEFKNLVPEAHEQKTILWIGRFEPEKDPLAAIHILQEVRAMGVDAKLVMLGTGSLEKSLRAHAGALPIGFPGWQDPKPYLAKADVVLCTSKHESYGASIIEALAAGVPVVAPDVGIAKEAGAIVTGRLSLSEAVGIHPRSNLGGAVAEVLRTGVRGELKLSLPNVEEWAKKWKETLV